jgi:hypothetical protein
MKGMLAFLPDAWNAGNGGNNGGSPISEPLKEAIGLFSLIEVGILAFEFVTNIST